MTRRRSVLCWALLVVNLGYAIFEAKTGSPGWAMLNLAVAVLLGVALTRNRADRERE